MVVLLHTVRADDLSVYPFWTNQSLSAKYNKTERWVYCKAFSLWAANSRPWKQRVPSCSQTKGLLGGKCWRYFAFPADGLPLVVFPSLVSFRFEPEIYLQSFLAHGCVISLPALTADGHIVWWLLSSFFYSDMPLLKSVLLLTEASSNSTVPGT